MGEYLIYASLSHTNGRCYGDLRWTDSNSVLSGRTTIYEVNRKLRRISMSLEEKIKNAKPSMDFFDDDVLDSWNKFIENIRLDERRKVIDDLLVQISINRRGDKINISELLEIAKDMKGKTYV